jgi:hypothetical protein
MKQQYKQLDGLTSADIGTVTPLSADSIYTKQAIVTVAPGSVLTLGPTNTATYYLIGGDGRPDYYIIQPPSGVVDLKDWHVKSTAASQTFHIAYL